jgi:uncharacterized protein Veg
VIEKNDLSRVKNNIQTCVGLKVQLKTNKGRKKVFIEEGILENTYPSIFVVKFENEYETIRRVSYSYTDVLTNAVELVICKEDKKIRVS